MMWNVLFKIHVVKIFCPMKFWCVIWSSVNFPWWSTLQNVIDTYKLLSLGHKLLWLLQWLQKTSISTRNTQYHYLHCSCGYYHSNRLWKCSAWFAQKGSESAKIALTLGIKIKLFEFLRQAYDAYQFYIAKDRNHKEFLYVHHLITPVLLCI